MKLIIKRNQADVKGMFGGHKGVSFALSARADITAEERELIDRYKVAGYILTDYELPIKGSQSIHMELTVEKLINGYGIGTGDIGTLLELEEKIKQGCQNLKTILEVMRTFGGEEVLEI